MLNIRLRYEMSKMRKKTYREYYVWLKNNKICPGCKSNYADNNFVKCAPCRHNDRLYKQNKRMIR